VLELEHALRTLGLQQLHDAPARLAFLAASRDLWHGLFLKD
jgi:hypothetical protein